MNYKALFVISLAINVGIGLYALGRYATAPGMGRVEPPPGSKAPIANPADTTAASVATNAAGNRFNWESVESSDYKQYIANLRSVGCPEETIRDIIRADVNKLYEEKKKQVRMQAPKFSPFKAEGFEGFIRGAGREAWMKMFSLDEERDSVLRALGMEPDSSQKTAKNSMAMEWMLDFLGDEKKAQVLRLRKELEDRLAMREPGSLDADGITRLWNETDDAIKRLLTPSEAVQYELTTSPPANLLRRQLSAFEPTEQEFIALYKLRKTYEETLPTVNSNDLTAAERRALRETSEKQWLEQVKQALGPQRFADYEMARDYAYQQMYQVAKEAGLGVPEAKQVYAMRKAAEEQAARLRSDQSLASEQRTAALDGIRQETERSVRAVLGEKGWEQFNRGGNNRWLDAISSRSP